MLEKTHFTPEIELAINKDITTNIISHSCQLFQKGGKYGHKPYGSGILIKISNAHFLATAAHVTENLNEYNTLFIKGPGYFIPVLGDLRETDISIKKHADLAYIKLHDSIIDPILKRHNFLSLGKILGNHTLLDAAQYCILGFPEKNIRVENGKIQTGASYYIVKPSKEKVYNHYNFDTSSFVLFEFKGKGEEVITGQTSQKIDDPYGISGCGIWFIKINSIENNISVDYFLIGLIIGGKKGKYHILYGNKVDVLIDGMIRHGDINIKFKL